MQTPNFKRQLTCRTFAFFAAVNHNYNNRQRNLEHRNLQSSKAKSTNHRSQTMNFWTRQSELVFPKRFTRINDGSEEDKCPLAFGLESLHVFEKNSKHAFAKLNLTLEMLEKFHICAVYVFITVILLETLIRCNTINQSIIYFNTLRWGAEKTRSNTSKYKYNL